MGLIVSVAGVAVILIVMTDFLATTIGATAYSPLSKHVARAAFALVRRFPHSKLKHRFSGVLVMTAIALWWIIGIASGWSLVFAGIGTSVVDADTGLATSFLGIVSHVGHLLSTVGGGVTKPSSLGWSLLGVAVGVNGMVVLTLSVSFVLSTTQTVARGRAFLIKIDHLSESEAQASHLILGNLADLVAMLNAAPFALYYSTVEANRRLPAGLTKLFTASADVDRSSILDILGELPWLELTDEDNTADILDQWSQQFAI